VVDSLESKNLLEDGYVEDIEADFGFIYYRKISFEGSQKVIELMCDPKSKMF